MVRDQPDELTGARSRADLQRGIAVMQEEYGVTGRDYCAVMLDVDHLKTINDVYGHAAGDAAIRTVAQRVMHALRAGDELYRYGGDEFVVLLPGATLSEGAAVMRRVRDHVIADPVDAGQWLNITISVGVASSREAAQGDVTSVLLLADSRLYQAKRAGRNSLVADDRSGSDRGGGQFAETRVFARDAQLARLDAFLNSTPQTAEERVLQLSGPAGAGISRLLSEAGIRAGLAGRTVRHLDVQPSHRSLHLRALELAYRDELSADASVDAIRARLQNDAETTGLVVLIEGGSYLDPASRQLLTERVSRHGTWLLEAVSGEQRATFPAGTEVSLQPLDLKDTTTWISAATAGPVEPGTASALHAATDGLPGVLAPLVTDLLDRNELKRTPTGLAADPALITERAAELRQAAAVSEPDLPAWDTPLVGRNQFLELLRPTALASRLLSLTGPGGIGKSRLAAQLALELSTQQSGGTHWVDLRSVNDTSWMLRVLSGALGMEPTDSLETLASRISGRELLLVLDEVDGVAGSAGVFPEMLRHLPNLRLIVTTRMPLRLAEETAVEVPELAAPAAEELFQQGMTRQGAQPADHTDALTVLLERIGLTPLSIELAAAWTRVFTPAELAAALDRQPEMLGLAPGLEPRTARFIDVTRQLMSSQEQEMLGILALPPAGFDAAQALEAAGASPFFLLALLERSLLRREGNRYTVHAAIAERYRAGLSDPAAARRRVTRVWVNLARTIDEMSTAERNVHGYRTIDAEESNLRFAWNELLSDPDPELLWPLVRVMRGYFDLRSRRRDGLDIFTRTDAAISHLPDLELRGWVRECVALFLILSDRAEEAKSVISEALSLLEQHGPPGETAAMAWNTKGYAHIVTHEEDLALEALYRSAELRAALGDKRGEAQALGNAAMTLAWAGRPDEAFTELKRSVDRHREIGNPSGLALSLGHLATLMREHGQGTLEERITVAEEAIRTAEEIGYTGAVILAGQELAEAHIELGEPLAAAAAFRLAARWARANENPELEGRLLARAAELTAVD